MNEVTLESLARRVEALERALELKSPPTDKDAWQRGRYVCRQRLYATSR